MTGRPLRNIRVVDLSRVFAMPFAGAQLADLGAEVIKIDTCQAQFMDTTRAITGPFPDNRPGELWWEQGGTFQTLNRGKRSLTLDLRSAEAQEILKRLVSLSDIVLENFTPRVMARFGLDYPALRAVKPDLIMVSNTGYGHTGPWRGFGAMASALEPTHGTGAFIGYLEQDGGESRPGNIPNKVGNSYTDFLATWTALLSVMAALLHRAETGRGTWIDLAMYQAGAAFTGEGLLAAAYHGHRANRIGNRHPYMAPHGCYPCQGQDQWVTIAVRDDADWPAFCAALNAPELAADPRFATARQRLQLQDELDAIISDWTRQRTSYQVMETLQNRRRSRRAGIDRRAGPGRSALPASRVFRGGVPSAGNRPGRQRIHRPRLAVFRQRRRHRRPGAAAGRGQRLRPAPNSGAIHGANRSAGAAGNHRRPPHRRQPAIIAAAGHAGRTGLDRRLRPRFPLLGGGNAGAFSGATGRGGMGPTGFPLSRE